MAIGVNAGQFVNSWWRDSNGGGKQYVNIVEDAGGSLGCVAQYPHASQVLIRRHGLCSFHTQANNWIQRVDQFRVTRRQELRKFRSAQPSVFKDLIHSITAVKGHSRDVG